MASSGYSVETESASNSPSIPEAITAGLAWGVAMWSAYAILEYFLLSAIPLFLGPQAIFTASHWRLSGLLFGGYWILGAITGAAAGTLIRYYYPKSAAAQKRRLDLGRLPATLGLLLAVEVNLLVELPLRSFAKLTLCVAVALSIAILWVLRHPGSRLVSWVEFHPFLMAFILISPTWLSTDALEDYSLITKIALVALTLAAVAGVNLLLRRAPQWSAARHFISGIAVLALIVVACAFRSGGDKVVAPTVMPTLPNPGRAPVVMVSLDTTRADHTSLYGYSRKTTPHLAAFAEGATLYTNTVAAGDMTLQTHASIFTGVFPGWHGAKVYPGPLGGPRALNGKLATLAGILSSHGYSTAGIVANSAYLVPEWGLNRGFDRFDVETMVEATSATRTFQLRHGMRALLSWLVPTTEFDLRYRRARDINDEAFRVISKPEFSDRSFFLFVNYMDAHAPYLPPAPFDKLYLSGANQVNVAHHPSLLLQTNLEKLGISSAERERQMAQYDGGIAYEDSAFQQLIDWLKQKKLYDQSLIIVVGDHGEAFGDHGAWGHGKSIYRDQINVPLVIKYPAQTTAAVVDAPVSQVDLLPTVMDTLGYDAPSYVQGRSLRHVDQLGGREFLSESVTGTALRSGMMKLLVFPGDKRELYDLAADPGETHDLHSASDPVSCALDADFNQWLRTMPYSVTTPSTKVDPNELRRLRGLGYVQ